MPPIKLSFLLEKIVWELSSVGVVHLPFLIIYQSVDSFRNKNHYGRVHVFSSLFVCVYIVIRSEMYIVSLVL